MMRIRGRLLTGLALAMLVAIGGSAAASATPPVTLDPGYVTDQAGVLSPDELTAANAQLQELSSKGGPVLFVVFVDDFTSPSDRQQWADDVANDNGLGSHQYLLAVAVEGRQYYISADSAGPLSDDRVSAIERRIEPYLGQNDWAGAIAAAADGFAGGNGSSGSTGGSSAGGGSGLGAFLVVAGILVVGAVVVILIVRRNRSRRPAIGADGAPALSAQDAERQAGSALVQTDDAVRVAADELGFAAAQFGDDATKDFSAPVDEAREKLAQAFSLRQQLDDEVPDTAEQRYAWHVQIIQLCAEANALLDANREAFDALGRLEKDAPAAIERVVAQRAQLQPALESATTALAALSQVYAPAALSTVAQNPEQAGQLLALTDNSLAEARERLAAQRTGEAAYAIHTAEGAVTQAGQLIGAITHLGADLAAQEDGARALVADLQADLAQAAQLPDADGRLAAVVAGTGTRLIEAQKNLAAPSGRQPQQTLSTLEQANSEIDAVLAQVRDAAAQAERARQMLQQKLLQAGAQVHAAQDYIATRRGAVGATPRTRLAEATAALAQAQALQTADPVQAVQYADRAFALAQQAVQYAEGEVAGFSGGQSSGMGSDILGGLIGGLIGSSIGNSRSRSSRSSWGGSSGSSWGGSSRSGRSGGGGFGGGRSSGGFSGGGRGRSGGGRF